MNTLTKMKFDFGICKKRVCVCVSVFVCILFMCMRVRVYESVFFNLHPGKPRLVSEISFLLNYLTGIKRSDTFPRPILIQQK